jgi:hypothetical protein
MKNFFESLGTATTGMLGVSATAGGFYVSILPMVEAWLRVLSLFIGCAVGIATLVSIIRKHKSKAAVPRPSNQNEESQK